MFQNYFEWQSEEFLVVSQKPEQEKMWPPSGLQSEMFNFIILCMWWGKGQGGRGSSVLK